MDPNEGQAWRELARELGMILLWAVVLAKIADGASTVIAAYLSH